MTKQPAYKMNKETGTITIPIKSGVVIRTGQAVAIENIDGKLYAYPVAPNDKRAIGFCISKE